MAILMFGSDNRMSPFYISSSGNSVITSNPLDTRLYFLGTASWSSSISRSFSGSNHDRLFWMYDNAGSFPTNYGNLYYITYQSRSLTSTTFTTGALSSVLASYTSPGFYTNAIPPINAPAYNYQLSASKTTISILEATTQSINNWTTLLQDSLRSGSGNTIFDNTPQGYGGQFNTSSGAYTFIRQNLPFNPVEAIPVEISLSFGDGSFTNRPDSQTPPQYPVIVRIISGSTVLRSTSFTLPETPNIGDNYSFFTTLNIYSGSNGSSANLNAAGGITMSIINSDPQYPVTLAPINLNIKQPLTGRQIAAETPLINIFDTTSTPTANDTGSYYVITPNLRGADDVTQPPLYQLNSTFAVYYFKTAYHLWRDAWRIQNSEGGPICSEATWISASTNPSWAAYDIGNISTAGPNSVPTRNAYGLYASRSGVFTFENYGIYSTDGAVRNRSYVGITAELLGGSELIKHLKGNRNGTISASFTGNKFGGAIVVKASRVSTNSPTAADRYFPGTSAPPVPSSFIYYKPGNGNSGQTEIYNPGLPITEVNDGDVIPLSNFGYEFNTTNYAPSKSNMDWPSDIPWPPANPNVSNSFYGY